MPLVVEKTEEQDIPRLLDILYAAFHDDPWDQIMFPRVPPPEARMASTKRWQHEISVDPHTSVIKVVDTDQNDEIIAFARWHIYRTERPESEWKDARPREWDEGTNIDAANAFLHAVRQKRQKIMAGKPHFCTSASTHSRKRKLIVTSRSEYVGYGPKAPSPGRRPIVDTMGHTSCG